MSSSAFAHLVAGPGLQQPPQPPSEYAVTEIKIFIIPQGFLIENNETHEGEIWANIVRIYLQDAGTGLLWWGCSLESPSIVKLVVGNDNLLLFETFY